MFSLLYPIAYIVSLVSLVLWFYFQDKSSWGRLVPKFFILGAIAYMVSLGMSEASAEYKFFVLFRDLSFMVVAAFVFNLFKNNTLLFFGLLVGFLGLFTSKGACILENTFPQKTTNQSGEAELDKAGELLIEVTEQEDIEALQSIFTAHNISFKRAFRPSSPHVTELDDYYVLDIPNGYGEEQLRGIIEQLENTDVIEWVETNEIIRLSPVETVPTVSAKRQFGINDPDLEQLWGFEAMNVDQLYKGLAKSKIQPRKKALVAILDTGVDAKHEDIAANFISINSKYDKDSRGHGTHCAGIAAAVSNNKVGIASFAPNNQFVQVTSIQVLSGFGIGTQKGIIDGMILAADKGADVISMSLGGLSNGLKQKAYQDAVKYCHQKGAIIVVAAGNSNADARKYTPANLDGVITVSAIDQNLNRATFSNFVTHLKMGVAAPGVAIYSTIPDNKYATFNGTSMATPYVAGLVGVLKSIRPGLTTKEAYAILNESGVATNSTNETGKLIQPARAIELVID